MGIVRKDSRDSEVQFMGDVKHKYRIKRDGTELYKETGKCQRIGDLR